MTTDHEAIHTLYEIGRRIAVEKYRIKTREAVGVLQDKIEDLTEGTIMLEKLIAAEVAKREELTKTAADLQAALDAEKAAHAASEQALADLKANSIPVTAADKAAIAAEQAAMKLDANGDKLPA